MPSPYAKLPGSWPTYRRAPRDWLFKPGEEVIAYQDLGELRQQLDYYLTRPDEARAIGDNARRRALAEHTLGHRLDEIMTLVESGLKR